MKYLFLMTLFISSSLFAVEVDPTDPPGSTEDPGVFSRLVNRTMAYAQDLGFFSEEGSTDYIAEDAFEVAAREAAETTRAVRSGLMGTGQCLIQQLNDSVTNPESVRGARLLMATMYQSCEAPNITVSNTSRARSSPVSGKPRSLRNQNVVARYNSFNPYLANRSSVRNGCFNVLEQPPIYGYGAKPSTSGGVINLHQNQARRPACRSSGVACNSQPVSAIDCSGFITGALRRMGLNLRPGMEFNPGMINTSAFNREASRNDSCLNFINASQAFSIVPGDIINVGGNHVIMVDEIGQDPLGLQKHARNNTCGSLSKDDFDFKFLHSGAAANLGLGRLDASHPEMSNFMSLLEVKTRVACNEIRNGSNTILASSSGNGLSVIRHAGNSKPGCKGEPEVFENEGCVSGCGIL